MRLRVEGMEWHARTLRAWQLAMLRFAVTLDNADRLAVLRIAGEIDRLDPRRQSNPDFRFFRKTSAELCAAIMRPNELSSTVLRQYLARIDDDRLRRIFAQPLKRTSRRPLRSASLSSPPTACGKGLPPGATIDRGLGARREPGLRPCSAWPTALARSSRIETARNLIRRPILCGSYEIADVSTSNSYPPGRILDA
jgi:hypothetical protein